MRVIVLHVALAASGLVACQSAGAPRPSIAEPTGPEAALAKERSRGEAEALARIRAGAFALLVPSAVPVRWMHAIRVEEYAKYGINYELTGDALSYEFEAYRTGFNETMERAIRELHGDDIFERIRAEIHRRLVEEKQTAPRESAQLVGRARDGAATSFPRNPRPELR